jgi:hypothetical protein
VPGGTVDALAAAPSDPNRLYGLLQGVAGERLYRSDDAALSWQATYTFTKRRCARWLMKTKRKSIVDQWML